MQIHEFAKVYQTKTDEELLELAAVREQMTPEARLAIEGELSRRQISVAVASAAYQQKRGHDVAARALPDERPQDHDRLNVSSFIAEALQAYHERFWLYFRITAPAVIIGAFAIFAARTGAGEILRGIPRGIEALAHPAAIFEVAFLNLSGFLASWLAFAFAFGATCIALEESFAGFAPSARTSFRNIGQRLGPFVLLSLLLFLGALLAVAAATLLGIGVFWILNRLQVHPSRLLFNVISYGLSGIAFFVLSRFVLAVPAVLLDDYSVGQALFRSDELTEGKWPILAVLLAKSVIGGYVAGMLPFWLASYVSSIASLPSSLSWLLTGISVVGVTVVEPTMFVGFALLYLKMSALRSEASDALVGGLV